MAYVCYVVFASEGLSTRDSCRTEYVDLDVSECPQTRAAAIARPPVAVVSVAGYFFFRPGYVRMQEMVNEAHDANSTPDLSMPVL